MNGRLVFGLIAAFWLTMNFLLWRMEWGGGQEPSARVPMAVLWDKILTAPDHSALEIFRQGKSIGYCRWAPEVRDDLARAVNESEDFQPEGRMSRPTAYLVDCDGSVWVTVFTNRLKFSLHLGFDTNREWRDLSIQIGLRQQSWEIKASALEERVQIQSKGQEGVWQQEYRFEELRDPRRLLEPAGAGWLMDAFGGGLLTGSVGGAASVLNWVAYQDWLVMGHTRLRGYRIKARLLDRYSLGVVISRVGEILRVELPGEITLANEIITAR
jgi:hypothetical protein